MPQDEIYALKYAGPLVRTGAQLMWYQDWDRKEKINYYFWCIKGAGTTVVVEAGITPQLARERGLEGYVNPAEVWMKTYDKLRAKASSPDLLFPGHDRRLLENYPEVAPDISRLV